MSHTLHSDFVISSKRGPVYWWPLILEAMSRHDFQFSAPDLPKGTSRYFYARYALQDTDDPPEVDAVIGPFQALWDEIFLEAGDVIASLWFKGPQPFVLEAQVSPLQADLTIAVNLIFEGAEVMALPQQEVRKRLRLVVACAQTLYEVCQPNGGELYWMHAGYRYAPWASFGVPPQKPSQERPPLEAPESSVVTQTLAGGGVFYLIEPVPFPRRGGGWDFIRLSDEEDV